MPLPRAFLLSSTYRPIPSVLASESKRKHSWLRLAQITVPGQEASMDLAPYVGELVSAPTTIKQQSSFPYSLQSAVQITELCTFLLSCKKHHTPYSLAVTKDPDFGLAQEIMCQDRSIFFFSIGLWWFVVWLGDLWTGTASLQAHVVFF